MSDHWNALARLLGAPGASSKTPVAPPVEKTEAEAPAPSESLVASSAPIEEPEVVEPSTPVAASEPAPALEPPAFDAQEKNWKSLAELLNLQEEAPAEAPAAWATPSAAKKPTKPDPKAKKSVSKRRNRSFADGLGFDSDQEECTSEEHSEALLGPTSPF